MSERDGVLLVSATPTTHRRFRDALRRLRYAYPSAVVLEAAVVELDEAALKRIERRREPGSVAFARELRAKGKDIVEAAAEAARLRFRPVLMTAFSFIFGVLPLVFASGAGSASQQAVGTAVFGGMMASTALAVLFVPVFFVIFQRLSEFKRKPKAASKEPAVQTSDI